MFSGLIRHFGAIKELAKSSEGLGISIESDLFEGSGVKVGDSICVNGVCLTVASITCRVSTFFAVNESLRKSNLGELTENERVHLEPSLRVGDTIDGHFVYGHVDGVLTLLEVLRDGESFRFTFEAGESLLPYIAPKGSVSLDGVSLTIAETYSDSFSVYIIPHTFSVTRFSSYEVGDKINIEVDTFARYAVHYMKSRESL